MANYKENPSHSTPCDVCRKNPLAVDGCCVGVIFIGGERFPRIRFFGDQGERCHDCNTLNGHFHHWGCDAEIYPSCGGQLIGCDCMEVECPVI